MPGAFEVPRTFGPIALAGSTCALAIGGQPWLAAGLVAEAVLIAGLGPWFAPVHHRWIDRVVWGLVLLALLVCGANAVATLDVTWPVLLFALDLGVALLLAGWFDATGLAARAALEPDPAKAGRLRLRVLALGGDAVSPSDPSTRPSPLPTDEAALVARLDALGEWRSGVFHPIARPGRAAALREALARAAGALLLLVPLLGLLLFVGLPWPRAFVAVHGVAGVAFTWGLMAVALEHLVQRIDGVTRAIVSWALLVGTVLVLVVIGLHVDAQLEFGVELDPGQGTENALGRLQRLLTRPEPLGIALTLAFGVAAPAALWGALARLDSTPERPLLGGPSRVRRTTGTLGGTPWFLATTLTFLIDTVVYMILLHSPAGSNRAPLLFFLGPPIFGLHAALAALAFGGLRLADRRRRAGVRHTIEDERRRVVAALVRLREERANAADPGRFAGGAESR